MKESVLEEGTRWVKFPEEEKCDTIEEVKTTSGDLEGVSQDQVRGTGQ